MAPTSLRKLIALQNSRSAEIELTSSRLRERSRDSLNSNIISSRVNSLTEIWSKARATHEEIVVREDALNDVYITENVFARLQATYEDALDFLLTTRSELDSSSSNTGTSNTASVINDDTRPAKLPKLDLPTFAGRYEDWENFCDLFTTLVHNAPRLSDATKLQYLKSCLKDSAADLVKDVTTTNANYATTWRALKARFHNPRLIVYSHLRALMNLSHMKRESAGEMRLLADESQRIVRALSNLKMPVDHWDVWLVYIVASRLDPDSRKAWETELSKKDRQVILNYDGNSTEEDALGRFPRFSDLTEFLENRAQTLCMLTSEQGDNVKKAILSKPISGSRKVFHASTSFSTDGKFKCVICSGPHRIFKCNKFKAKNVSERRAEVLRLRLCFNCLGAHRVANCSFSTRCSSCKGRHHSLLHSDKVFTSFTKNSIPESKSSNSDESKTGVSAKVSSVHVHTANVISRKRSVLLATAQIMLIGPQGSRTRVRALLDQGSEASFVSSFITNLLGLEKRRVNMSLVGLGASSAGTAKAATQLIFQSVVDPSTKFEVNAFVLSKLTSQLPTRRLMEIDIGMFADLSLADPLFYVPDSVDIILGADVYGQLLKSGLKRFSDSSLVAQDTALGWIISGTVSADISRRAETSEHLQAYHSVWEDDLDISLQRFWILEELPPIIATLDSKDDACERLFRDTHFRDTNGRYVVRLPFNSDPPEVGVETRFMALKCLASIHRRFDRDPDLAIAYRKFMSVYEDLGHMERVSFNEINNSKAWYFPHHAVVRSKIRVVFDASRKNKGGRCPNDFLMKGPALQRDLCLILLNWRRYQFVFTTDVVKMFRQIYVASEQRDFQRIVWSPSHSDPPVDYRLTTVTYGTACAPYLAIRTLQQVAIDEGARFPLGAACLNSNTYVDDIFAGADDLSDALKTRQELVDMLRTAGIELDKWAANHNDLLPTKSSQYENIDQKSIADDELVKALGIRWNPTSDEFSFVAVNFEELVKAMTKRTVLSNIARLFDPLGWLAPITVTAKILMQDLWIVKCDWDETLPIDLRERWLQYCSSLSELSKLTINRWLGASLNSHAQIHGFSDASSRAFAAVVYIRMIDGNNRVHVSLLTAKCKVSPVKTVSIPNLELCGAVLLVKLLRYVKGLEFLQGFPMFAWTDSQIVLTWLRKHPCSWKTFVANRVSYIQTELPNVIWAHVPTRENPADLATRGCKPSNLINCNLWWNGPDWLVKTDEHWPKMASSPQVLHVDQIVSEPELFCRFSSFSLLIRVVAYCLRPFNVLKRRKSSLTPLPVYLTAIELNEARNVVFRLAQNHAFASEIELLSHGKPLPKRNGLCSLNPMYDETDRLLRVGGRLGNSSLPHEKKHPLILPRDSTLSRLLVRYAHRKCFHGGPTLTSNIVMQYAWILGRNRLVKTAIRNCIVCQRNKPRLAHQMMGNLPVSRVTPARPFSTSGLDYAGPFQIKSSKGRGHKSYKGYIVLFICFASRAIHLEAVSDLTTKIFLAAYKRFASRRGICTNLFSDNATTFQAADKELRTNSPHYGGLWEVGVRSVKYHLKRVLGDRILTFEEFSTVLAEVELCLNSRPICPLNSDIDDLRVLTPAHFLIGEIPGLIPDKDYSNVPENCLERFHLLQAIRNDFWKRWSSEYIQHLQERSKWRGQTKNFAIGQLVLLRDDRYPPSKWPLGRVIEVHPGSDGLVRVVTVKTATSNLRRHIARLCPLFIQHSSEKSNESTCGDKDS
ncbi:uncharacterized protein LOC143364322 [Halictus rubicundus]|uniref:uncharacterized protein LOC143364322 n=1 Tax=Halictus rubicundus TaxID=77578 RepID=UPI004035739D